MPKVPSNTAIPKFYVCVTNNMELVSQIPSGKNAAVDKDLNKGVVITSNLWSANKSMISQGKVIPLPLPPAF